MRGAGLGTQKRGVKGGMPLVSGDSGIQMYSANLSCGNNLQFNRGVRVQNILAVGVLEGENAKVQLLFGDQ